jgi:hypothetical protein
MPPLARLLSPWQQRARPRASSPSRKKKRSAGGDVSEYLKGWFSFRGRIGRRQYWISTLLYLLAWFLGAAILITLAALNYNPPDDTITNVTIVGFLFWASR